MSAANIYNILKVEHHSRHHSCIHHHHPCANIIMIRKITQCNDWSIGRVQSWLEANHFKHPRLLQQFQQHKIDGQKLLDMNKGQMKFLCRFTFNQGLTKRLQTTIVKLQRDFTQEMQRVASVQRLNASRQQRANVRPRNVRYVRPVRRRNQFHGLMSGEKWTNGELGIALFLNLARGKSFESIGLRLGRSEIAVLNQVNLIKRAFKEGTAHGNPLTYRGSYLSLIRQQKSIEQARTDLRKASNYHS